MSSRAPIPRGFSPQIGRPLSLDIASDSILKEKNANMVNNVCMSTSATCAGIRRFTQYMSAKTSQTRPLKVRVAPTPVKAKVLDFYLEGYIDEPRFFLVEGFSQGFRIPSTLKVFSLFCVNDISIDENLAVVSDMLRREIQLGRIKGPFDSPPMDDFHVSPIKLVAKSTPGEFRLIHNLSFPYDECAVNFNIDDEFATVQYASIQDAIALIQKLGPGCFMGKSDIAQAFRNLPIHEDCHHLLGFIFEGKYYYDTCLAMGARCSCQIFECFSTALQWILETKFKVENCLHILDDFFFISLSFDLTCHYLKCWVTLAEDIGVPIKWEKTTKVPDYVCIFAGVQLNGLSMTASLPNDKLQRYTARVRSLLQSRKATLQDVQSVIGNLQWATGVVIQGKAFLRRLINLTIGVRKPYYYVTLNSEAQADLKMWEHFLDTHTGKSLFLPSFENSSAVLNLYTDSSSRACGAVLGSDWFQISFPEAWRRRNIAFLELYPIVVAIHMFADVLADSRVCFYTDNEAVKEIINKQSCKVDDMMVLVRALVVCCMKRNIAFRAMHIPGVLNVLPDRISRFQVNAELLKSFRMNPEPVQVPSHLLPLNWEI